jgi:hypothetical protein
MIKHRHNDLQNLRKNNLDGNNAPVGVPTWRASRCPRAACEMETFHADLGLEPNHRGSRVAAPRGTTKPVILRTWHCCYFPANRSNLLNQ